MRGSHVRMIYFKAKLYPIVYKLTPNDLGTYKSSNSLEIGHTRYFLGIFRKITGYA